MSDKQSSYLIIGGGVFGASTAYHLSRAHPGASIILLDRTSSFPNPVAASHDYNKICRADYSNLFYCRLALEALEAWYKDSLFKPFFHRTGMAVIDFVGHGPKIIENYKTLGAHPSAMTVSPNELRKRYDKLFEDAIYEGSKGIFINPLSGWADATLAVRKVTETAISNGVQYISGDVETLTFDANGDCSGVKTKDGRVLEAGKIILSTGAGTARLLANSAPDRKELQSGDRITAAGVVTGCFLLNQVERERFKNIPVLVHESSDVRGVFSQFSLQIFITNGVSGEVIPATSDGFLKICVDYSFKNTSLHAQSGQIISAPPDDSDQGQHNVPQSLQDECRRAAKGIFGKELPDRDFHSFRICWYERPLKNG